MCIPVHSHALVNLEDDLNFPLSIYCVKDYIEIKQDAIFVVRMIEWWVAIIMFSLNGSLVVN